MDHFEGAFKGLDNAIADSAEGHTNAINKLKPPDISGNAKKELGSDTGSKNRALDAVAGANKMPDQKGSGQGIQDRADAAFQDSAKPLETRKMTPEELVTLKTLESSGLNSRILTGGTERVYRMGLNSFPIRILPENKVQITITTRGARGMLRANRLTLDLNNPDDGNTDKVDERVNAVLNKLRGS